MKGVKLVDEITVENIFLVGAGADQIVIVRSSALSGRITKENALNLAAWLVALADDVVEPRFGKLLREVLST